MKHHASWAVASGQAIIEDAADLFQYYSKNLTKDDDPHKCTHFRRSFFWVPSTDITRERGDREIVVRGTRLLHNVKTVEPGKLLTRRLACFCQPCVLGKGQCINIEYVGEWETVKKKDARSILLLKLMWIFK